MKTGFDLYRGDYVPQDYVPQQGFSAQSESKIGKQLSFKECVEQIQINKGKPFTIIGQPGSGKTVIMKRLARVMLEKKEQNEKSLWRQFKRWFRKDSEAILHLNIRDVANMENATLAQVLFSPSVIIGLTKLEAQYGLHAIIENKMKITIFLDGLDQASWYPDTKIKVGPWNKSTTATIFGNILAGHLLSDVPIMISSREHSVAGLSRDMRPEFIAALVGFAEADAKDMYCQIMGDEAADKDWEEMRMANPGMMYMCLTPLFLIFYMITRKNDPDDPPDCASEVMIRIIRILLESTHMHTVSNVINKLKEMAFQGTKEQRVAFTKDDLEKFNIKFEDVSDIIIKVAGMNILGQRLLDGMYRFFFSHQTLQEVLSALHVIEMSTCDFKKVVSTEFGKPYWSIVRNFSCGILKNERVSRKIDDQILKQSETEVKWEYLREKLESQLRLNPTPAQKLDIFMALKEANALEILQSHAQNLDFSDSPMTPSMIYILCSVMKHLKHVPSLSLANCDLDDVLLEVIGNSTEKNETKIEDLDVRENLRWTDAKLWKKIFQNLSISNCKMEIPRSEQGESSIDLVLHVVEAAHNNGVHLNLEELDKMNCNIEQLISLIIYDVKIKVSKLWMTPDPLTFDGNIWQQTFEQIKFDVDHCFVEAPLGCADVEVWIQATRAVTNVGQVSMKSRNDILLDITSIISLNNSGLQCDISNLRIKIDQDHLQPTISTSIWHETFLSLNFNVDHCFIEAHNSSEAAVLVEIAKAVDVDNVKLITLMQSHDLKVKAAIDDVVALDKPKFRVRVSSAAVILNLASNHLR